MNIKSILHALPALSIAIAACGGSTPTQIQAPTVPEALKAPADEIVHARFKASGSQIYTCKSTMAAGATTATWGWVFKAPDAMLMDDNGTVEGSHSAGPTWKSNDGSSVVGMVAAKADSPAAGAIQWLLLNAVSHDGTGVFTPVTHVQRVDTSGGVAPTDGCDMTQDGKDQPVSYTATYYFYSK